MRLNLKTQIFSRQDPTSFAPSATAADRKLGSRQRLHRGIDIGLMALASASMVVFLLAYGVIRHFHPSHAFWLEIGALGGFLLSMLLWLVVALVTPAPLVMKDAAMTGARIGLEKLPEEIRDRIPEDLRLKISGQS